MLFVQYNNIKLGIHLNLCLGFPRSLPGTQDGNKDMNVCEM